jgi:predicted  nucleic acid-binding Zn-ribbon protein
MADSDRTASLMTPAKLAQVNKPKAAVTPAAWLDQMASDAGHQHVRRLAELSTELQAQGQLRDFSPVAAELARLAEALPRLDFGLLQARGWWARTTGKSRTAGAEFASQFEQIEEVARSLAAQAQGLRKAQQEQSGAGERSLVELEVEFRAIDKIIDQGARWLQDMRNQLKARTATANGAEAEKAIQDDAARCEILVDRLKVLRAVSSAAQQVHQHAQAAAARRSALSQLLQQALAADVKAWQSRLSALAAVAGDGKSPALNLEEPMETHRELQLCVKQAIADCGQLDSQEKVLAHGLAALAKQVEAAR